MEIDEQQKPQDENIEAAAPPDTEEPLVSEDEILALAATQSREAIAEIPPETSTSDADSNAESAHAAQAAVSAEQRAFASAAMETLLFMSDKPVSLPKLRSLIDETVPLSVYRELMTALRTEFIADHRGVEIAEVSLGFQLRTKPHMASVLRKLVKTTPLKLTGAMMELMAAVAYKQPVTKDEVDQIRGVDCGYLLRNLMEKRLIRITGRSDLPGRPILYGTTHEFLELFSLKDLRALPPLHEIESMVAASEVGVEDKEKQDLQSFGKMVDASLSAGALFDDSHIDAELEEIKKAIESIPVSTSFIEEQKAREKLFTKLQDLATRGLTLDSGGHEVPLGSVPEGAAYAMLSKYRDEAEARHWSERVAPVADTPASDTASTDATATTSDEATHEPSPELEAAAQAAQQERHDEMLQQATDASAEIPGDVSFEELTGEREPETPQEPTNH